MNISSSQNDNTNRGEILTTINRYINTIDNFNSNITILLNTYDSINEIIPSRTTRNNVHNPQHILRRNEPVQTRAPRRATTTTAPVIQPINIPNLGIRTPVVNTSRPQQSNARRPNTRQSSEYINNSLNLDYNSSDDIIPNWTFQIDLRDEENTRRTPLYNYFYNYLTRQFNELGDVSLIDVIVAPSLAEINNATRTIVFDSSASYVNTSCPISLEPFEHGQEICEIIHCGHLFNTDELHNWFRRNVRCPVCRHDIRTHNRESSEPREQDSVASTNNQTNESTPTLNIPNQRNHMSELFGNILQTFNTTTPRLNYVSASDPDYTEPSI